MSPNLVFLLSLFFVFAGYVLKKIRVFGEEDSKSLSRIIMNVTLPALIIRTIVGAELKWSLAFLPLAAVAYGVVVCGILLFVHRKAPPEDKAMYSMGSIGFNNGMFAYPIVEGVYGSAGLGFLAIFDIGSGLSVFGVSYMLAAYFNAKKSQGNFQMTLGVFLKMIAKSVPFVCYLLAIAWNVSGLGVPPFVGSVLAVPARANMVLVLLLIGLHLEFSFDGADMRKVVQIFSLRYGLGIILGIITFLLPVSDDILHGVLVILFILPVSMAVIPYSNLFDFDSRTAGVLVNYSIVISFILMWIGINMVSVVIG